MPSLSELPSSINIKRLTRALERLGFFISTKGGKGSHIKVTYNRTQKSITVPRKINKNVLNYLLKEIEICSGVTWEDIKQYL